VKRIVSIGLAAAAAIIMAGSAFSASAGAGGEDQNGPGVSVQHVQYVGPSGPQNRGHYVGPQNRGHYVGPQGRSGRAYGYQPQSRSRGTRGFMGEPGTPGQGLDCANVLDQYGTWRTECR
jgi:hypothetical protein